MNILVECNPDEYIISVLVVNPRRIKHGQGKGKALQGLRNGKGVVAVIDEDPVKGRMSLLNEYRKEWEIADLIFYSHTELDCWLIVIKPDLKNWLLKRANIDSAQAKEGGRKRGRSDRRSITNTCSYTLAVNKRLFLSVGT